MMETATNHPGTDSHLASVGGRLWFHRGDAVTPHGVAR